MASEKNVQSPEEIRRQDAACFRTLLDWYQGSHRDLLFRQDRQPYHIWVSEIMAQQTRIEAMIPYYERFMKQFPTVQDLAAADEDTLHKAWQGLGYYARARNLQKAARILTETGFPETKEELMKLPGIGPYTAGAIASISFEQKAAAVDGNVLRVFSRLYDIQEDVMRPAVKRQIEKLVLDAMIRPYGDFTQALMELGALICTPGTPDCGSCPVNRWCRAGTRLHCRCCRRKSRRRKRKKRFSCIVTAAGSTWKSVPLPVCWQGSMAFPEGCPGRTLSCWRNTITHSPTESGMCRAGWCRLRRTVCLTCIHRKKSKPPMRYPRRLLRCTGKLQSGCRNRRPPILPHHHHCRHPAERNHHEGYDNRKFYP